MLPPGRFDVITRAAILHADIGVVFSVGKIALKKLHCTKPIEGDRLVRRDDKPHRRLVARAHFVAFIKLHAHFGAQPLFSTEDTNPRIALHPSNGCADRPLVRRINHFRPRRVGLRGRLIRGG